MNKVRDNNDEEQNAVPILPQKVPLEKPEDYLDYCKKMKKILPSFIEKIHELNSEWHFTGSNYELDDRRKKELEQYKEKWDLLMDAIDNIGCDIKDDTNQLLYFFQCNENGNMIYKHEMINEAGFEEGNYCVEGLVPAVLPIYLFELHVFFLHLASCAMSAVKTHLNIISIYNNESKGTEKYLTEEIKKVADIFQNLTEQWADIKKGQEQAQKDNNTILNKLEDIKRFQKVSDTTIKNRIDKTNEKVDKRNKKESRCELTQICCAEFIADKRETIKRKKREFLEALNLSTEKIKKSVDTEEERKKAIKNIARSIERWDTGKTKPPAGYSREKTEDAFIQWVNKTENHKLEKWKIRILKRLKNLSLDSVSEEQLHELMEQIR